jgi:hypothetical protein
MKEMQRLAVDSNPALFYLDRATLEIPIGNIIGGIMQDVDIAEVCGYQVDPLLVYKQYGMSSRAMYL